MNKYVKPSIAATIPKETICNIIDIPWISLWDDPAMLGELPEIPVDG